MTTKKVNLMTVAENKYKSLVSSGERNAPLKEQMEILARIAKLETISKKKTMESSEKSLNGRKWSQCCTTN